MERKWLCVGSMWLALNLAIFLVHRHHRLDTSPKFICRNPSINLGELNWGKAVATFEFENNSAQSRWVKEISTSCGCLAVNESPEEILPGSKAVIRAIWDTNGKRGSSYSLIRVRVAKSVNEPIGRHEMIVLSVTAKIQPDLEFRPANLQFSSGIDLTRKIELQDRCSKENDLHIVSAVSNHPSLVVSLDSPRSVLVQFVADAMETGRFPLTVRITTNHPEVPCFDIPVTVSFVEHQRSVSVK